MAMAMLLGQKRSSYVKREIKARSQSTAQAKHEVTQRKIAWRWNREKRCVFSATPCRAKCCICPPAADTVVVICLAGPSISSSKNIYVNTRGSLEEFGEFRLNLKVSDNVRPRFFARLLKANILKNILIT